MEIKKSASSLLTLACAIGCFISCSPSRQKEAIHIRVNQVGYLPHETKSAILFSGLPVEGEPELVREDGRVVARIKPSPLESGKWGRFHYYDLDFSRVSEEGRYFIRIPGFEEGSPPFLISRSAYGIEHEKLLEFMRQQRCGYNPYLDLYCHQKDGRSFYGPMADSTVVDARGGWHDAGDQLKYLITASYATAHMLLAYETCPDRFADRMDGLGRAGSNGIPDVLDEAKWGLDWILKLHPGPASLIHQVADDRDHVGWKLPDRDPSDYGWGSNSYRPAYFANGKPQGLGAYKSRATGVANLAGRSAAALALAARIWREETGDTLFSAQCLKAAMEIFSMGKKREGYQQGNSYGAPYRYGEITWTDDMEWGAAELYMTTGKRNYLEEAVRYARLASTESWMPLDSCGHYMYYPFINLGHYELFRAMDPADSFRDTLSGYYRSGIEQCLKRGKDNPFGVGVIFIWCSNNLMTSLITQILLYEKMTGDTSYHSFMVKQRDWLFGRNPWGTSMFTGIPSGGEYPEDVHTSIRVLTRKEVRGGLVDGPVYENIYRSLRGLMLTGPDEFREVQNGFVVYHDDIGDYSTNEPTMDGTAGSILMMAHFSGQ